MSSDNNSQGSGSGTGKIIWIGLLIVVLMILLSIPFGVMGLALKQIGFEKVLRTAVAIQSNPPPSPSKPASGPDLSGLRASVEQAAAKVFEATKVEGKKDGLEIQVEPPATLETAATAVHEVLSKNHQQYVEAVDPEKIHIIVIIKSSDWSALAQKLSEATSMRGFQYNGPSQTFTTTNSTDTMVAEIEILRK